MSFDTLLNLLPIFGTGACREVVANLSRRAFDFNRNHDDTPFTELPGVLAFLDLFRRHIHDGFWDERSYRECEQACSSPTASKIESRDFRARLFGLKAVVDKRVDDCNKTIGELVASHKQESLRGEFKLLDDAYICLPALALVQLGHHSGMECTVSSPYLPLKLLEYGR